jgi:3-oxoacyl-[acyl-carrier protein] reductase
VPRIRAVVTDLDNTLYPWVDYIVPCLEAMVDSLTATTGLPRIRIVQSLKEVYTRYESNEYPFAIQESDIFKPYERDFDSFNRLVVEPAADAFKAARARWLHPYPGVPETLEWIRAQGLKLVALSDAPRNAALLRLKTMKLDRLFDALYTLPGYELPTNVDARIRRREEAGHYRSGTPVHELPREAEKPSPIGLRRILDARPRGGLRGRQREEGHAGGPGLRGGRGLGRVRHLHLHGVPGAAGGHLGAIGDGAPRGRRGARAVAALHLLVHPGEGRRAGRALVGAEDEGGEAGEAGARAREGHMTLEVKYLDLAGRRALVAGGSSGIGLGIAEAFLEQGMKVVVHYRSHEAEARSLAARFPGMGFAVGAELAHERGAVDLVRESVRLLGGLDQLVHATGIWNDGPIGSIEAGRLEEIFRVNVFSAFYLVREALPFLRRGAPGNVVLVGSTAGQRGEAGHSHYAATKGAIQSLTMSLAVELAPGVRVNLVSPGWIRTPMAEEELATIGPLIAGALPNRRVGEVADCAHAALFLASNASSHLIGQDLCVSGGALLVVPRGQVVARQT